MRQSVLISAMVAAIALSGHADEKLYGNLTFQLLKESANVVGWAQSAPWKLPERDFQRQVSDEFDFKIYSDNQDEWHDMNTVNETIPYAGCFMSLGLKV